MWFPNFFVADPEFAYLNELLMYVRGDFTQFARFESGLHDESRTRRVFAGAVGIGVGPDLLSRSIDATRNAAHRKLARGGVTNRIRGRTARQHKRVQPIFGDGDADGRREKSRNVATQVRSEA